MAGPGLPVNIDSTYADSGTDATVQLHQQHHDAIDGIVNAFDTTVGTQASGQTLVSNGTVFAPGTPPGVVSPHLIPYGLKCANIADPAIIPNSAATFSTSTTYVFKMYTPVSITYSKMCLWLSNGGAGLAAWYIAAYDSTGTLVSGSTADVTSSISGNPVALSFGTTITAPAGYFYVVLRCGTSTTSVTTFVAQGYYDNVFLSGSAASTPATAYRIATISTWSGSTAPSSLGTIAQNAVMNCPVAVQ